LCQVLFGFRRLLLERRQYSRYFVSVEIEIKEVGGSFPVRGATTDVSLGGCYVAIIFPFAVGSQIDFTLFVADESVKGRGVVQTCHPGVGMGIRFIDLTVQDKLLLERYFSSLSVDPKESALRLYLR
jgi:PilZ domain